MYEGIATLPIRHSILTPYRFVRIDLMYEGIATLFKSK